MEVEKFTTSQKKKDEKFHKNQDNAHHILRYSKGIIHKELVPTGQTVTPYYLEVLRSLMHRIRSIRPSVTMIVFFRQLSQINQPF